MDPQATVFLTRPAGRNEALASRLRAEGLAAVLAPALAIRSLPTPRPRPVDGNLYLFVSRQAVDAYFSLVRTAWPAGAWAAAVGGATAQALRAFVPDDQVLVPAEAAEPDSESLLALIDGRALVPGQACILRATQGRDWMAEQLRSRGWTVTCHALYERAPVVLDKTVCETLARPAGSVLLVTSLEALDAIAASLRQHHLIWPAQLAVVTLHARMARRLQCWYADRPTDALHVTLSAPDEAALFQAILAASRLLH